MLKTHMFRWVGALLLSFALLAPGIIHAETASAMKLACVADQRAVGKGGNVRLHILYHQVDNKVMSKSWLKVKLPADVEVADAAGAIWLSEEGSLNWNLKELNQNGANVIHLNLKLKADAASDLVELSCSGGVDESVVVTQPVRIKVGTDIHQPVFNGYPDGGFHPDANLTRAETAAIISRQDELPRASKEYVYPDVPKTHWAYSYIQKVTEAGYMKGDNKGFRPDDPITRGEFVELLLRVRGIQPFPFHSFTDTGGHWAEFSAGTAKALLYFEGGLDGFAYLNNSIKREEAAKLLCIMFQRGELTDGEAKVNRHWVDVSEDRWSFGWIEELSMLAHESSSKEPLVENLIRYLPNETRPF